MKDWDQPDRWSGATEQGPPQEPIVFGRLKGFRMASWPERVAAGIVDYGVFLGLPLLVFGRLSMDFAVLVGIAGMLWNTGYMTSRTSQSLGKRLFKQHLVQVRLDTSYNGGRYMTYVPLPLACARIFLHVFDVYLLGFFFPIFHHNRATLADVMAKTYTFVGDDLPEITDTKLGEPEWS